MKRISFSSQFINKIGNDLIPEKIHTIRQNFEYWKKFEGKEVALFTWEGKPYHSNQKIFCVKRIVNVQEIEYKAQRFWFNIKCIEIAIPNKILAMNDGFREVFEFEHFFKKYKPGKMAILHFTDFKY